MDVQQDRGASEKDGVICVAEEPSGRMTAALMEGVARGQGWVLVRPDGHVASVHEY